MPAAGAVSSLDSPDIFPEIEVAALMHHGDLRNGQDYLCSMFNSVVAEFGQGFATTKAIVFAPQLLYLEDEPEADELYWDRGDTECSAWCWGLNSSSSLGPTISSFQALDELLLAASNRTRFPNLRRVIIAGHSGGGQTIQRYAFANRVDQELRQRSLDVRYFPANPSSWTYLSGMRPVLRESLTCDTICDNETVAATRYSFAESPSGGGRGCRDYNAYGYGLDMLDVPYYSRVGVDNMLRDYPSRHVTYLAGASDVCNAAEQRAMSCFDCQPDDHGLETTCADYAQGWCRFERAHAFAQHVRHHYDNASVHSILSVPGVGHNGCAIVQHTVVRQAMFAGLRGLLQIVV